MNSDKKAKVIFPLLKKEILISSTATIAKACELVGIPQDLVCGGKGTCKKCQVKIERNSKIETVLSCQENVMDGIKVFITNENKKTNILTENSISNIRFNPAIKKIYLDKSNLITPHCSGDWEHICNKLGIPTNLPKFNLLKNLPHLIHDKSNSGLTFTIWKDTIINIEPEDTSDQLYGLAIDLGTTSVVAYLYNLITEEKIGVYSSLNGQISEGADVISRIVSCINKTDGLEILQNKVIKTINKLIDSAVKENMIKNNSICEIAICGNSTMQHLFLGLHPEFLGMSPFTSVIQRDISLTAEELNLSINPNGIIHFLPLIGGFVGADTTGVLLSLPEYESKKLRLIIDLGTNGEIVIGNKDKYIATSTAAGPALEGAGIEYGMRGTTGAIERVKIIDGKVTLKVIGNETPIGICGSGLIDAIAEILRVGIINFRGKMLSKEEYIKSCKPNHMDLANNLCKVDGINVFMLYNDVQSENRVYISQKDVRNVQLAKGAIYTGCVLLLKKYGLKGENLDEILIAGAFGNYIDTRNGQYIGLLPSFDGVPVKSIGNAAGLGAQKFLISEEVQNNALPLASNVKHLELASDQDFQREYMKNTYFPKY